MTDIEKIKTWIKSTIDFENGWRYESISLAGPDCMSDMSSQGAIRVLKALLNYIERGCKDE